MKNSPDSSNLFEILKGANHMLTKKDAITIGKTFVDAANKVKYKDNKIILGGNASNEQINSVLIEALDSLWYDVFSEKVKEQFNYDKENFYKAVWGLY